MTTGPQVFSDPLFCAPVISNQVPNKRGNYRLFSASPCLPGSNPCGLLIGALPAGCSTTGLPGETPVGSPLRAFPNPFSASVTLELAPPPEIGDRPLTLRIFDIRGRLVRESTLPAGRTTMQWDGRGLRGRPLAPGIFFVRASSGSWRTTVRVVRIQ